MKFFVTIDNLTSGPYDHLQLFQLLQAGLIREGSQCCPDGSGGAWQPLSSAVPSLCRAFPRQGREQLVSVSDFQMNISSMVVFMLKWLVASIPAALIVLVLLTVAGGTVSAILAAFLAGMKP